MPCFLHCHLFFTVLSVVLVIVCYTFLSPMFALIISILVAPLLTRLPIEFHAARKLRKIIATFEEQNPKEETKPEEDEQL